MEVKKGFGYDKKHTFSNVMKYRNGIKQFVVKSLQHTNTFYFLITYGVCKKRKYCNRISEKKILFFLCCIMVVTLKQFFYAKQ